MHDANKYHTLTARYYSASCGTEILLKNCVIISVDPHVSINSLDHNSDYWIVDSKANLLQAKTLREETFVKSITTFKDRGNAVTNIIMMIPVVLEHHSDCDHIVIKGITPEDHAEIMQNIPELWSAKPDNNEIILKSNA